MDREHANASPSSDAESADDAKQPQMEMPIKKDADMGSGAGLGISICKQLVGLMKGALLPTQLELGLGLALGLALGLGLGLAYPYPEPPPPHPGELAVRSSLGKGTTVTVELPLAESSPPARDADEAGGAEAKAAHVRPLRVLLVEDNDYNVDVAKEMLEYMGHGVTVSTRSE